MALKVVAEGVETREQLVHLKVAGCDIAQGYHLGRPMPAEKIPEFLRTFPFPVPRSITIGLLLPDLLVRRS